MSTIFFTGSYTLALTEEQFFKVNMYSKFSKMVLMDPWLFISQSDSFSSNPCFFFWYDTGKFVYWHNCHDTCRYGQEWEIKKRNVWYSAIARNSYNRVVKWSPRLQLLQPYIVNHNVFLGYATFERFNAILVEESLLVLSNIEGFNFILLVFHLV